MQTLAADRLSSIEGEKGHFDKASGWLDKASNWVDELGATRRRPSIAYHRGRNLMKQGNYEGAEPYIWRALRDNRSWGELRYVAVEEFALAQIYAGMGQVARARGYAEASRDSYERLGIEQRRAEVEAFLQELPE